MSLVMPLRRSSCDLGLVILHTDLHVRGLYCASPFVRARHVITTCVRPTIGTYTGCASIRLVVCGGAASTIARLSICAVRIRRRSIVIVWASDRYTC